MHFIAVRDIDGVQRHINSDTIAVLTPTTFRDQKVVDVAFIEPVTLGVEYGEAEEYFSICVTDSIDYLLREVNRGR